MVADCSNSLNLVSLSGIAKSPGGMATAVGQSVRTDTTDSERASCEKW